MQRPKGLADDKKWSKTGGLIVPLGKFLYGRQSHFIHIKQARFNLFKTGLKGVINLYRS